MLQVLLHTLIDMARTEAEEASGEGREINHHGKAITVGGPKEDKDKDTDLLVKRVRRGGGGGVEGGGLEGVGPQHSSSCRCGKSVQLARLGREDLLLPQVTARSSYSPTGVQQG